MNIELPKEINLKTIFSYKKFVILPALSVVVIIGVSVFILVPQLRQMFVIQEEISKLKSDSIILEDKLELLSTLSGTSMDEDITLLEKVLPSRKAVIEWLTLLNTNASEHGVQLEKFSLRPGSISTASADTKTEIDNSSDGKTRKRISETATRTRAVVEPEKSFLIDVEVSGTVEGMRKFIASLLESAPVVRIEHISMETAKERKISTQSGLLSVGSMVNANLSIYLFYADPPRAIGGVGDELPRITVEQQDLFDEISSYRSFEMATTSAVRNEGKDIFAPF